MPTTDMKFVKGLNIAIIILAGLATLGSIACITLTAAGGDALSDPSLYSAMFYGFADEFDMYGHYYGGMSDANIAAGLFGVVFGLMIAVFVWCLICSAITVVSGILGLRNAEKPAKLGGAFVWAIVGAVAALLSGRLITTALLVASAIFISRVRKGAAASYTQAAYGYAPQPQYPYQAGYQQVPYQPEGSQTSYQASSQQPGNYQPSAAQQPSGFQPVGADYPAVYQQPQTAEPEASSTSAPAPAYTITAEPAAPAESATTSAGNASERDSNS